MNSNGSLDPAFNYCGCNLTQVTGVVEQADGKLLVSGVTPAQQAGVVRLNTDGSLDTTYSFGIPPVSSGTSSVSVWFIQVDGKTVAELNSEVFTPFSQRFYRIIRLNPDGSNDSTFASSSITSSNLFADISEVEPSADGKIYVAYYSFNGVGYAGTVLRLNANGGTDPLWEPPLIFPPASVPLSINGLTVLPDGGVVIAGHFSSVNGVSATGLVKLLSGGNVDLTFASTLGYAGSVRSLPDGKYLAGGTLTGSNYPQKLFRLNPNGSIDDKFSADNEVHHLLGKISLDQSQQSLFFAQRAAPDIYQISKFFRLNTNGIEDMTFGPNVGSYGTVFSTAVAKNNKIVVAGEISSIDGVLGRTVARLDPDGSVDTAFNAGIGFSRVSSQIIVQSDDKIVAIGNFEKVAGDNDQPWIARLNADGSFDADFRPVVTQVRAVGKQANGKIIIGGDFSTVNGISRTRLARLNLDGSLDSSFDVMVNGSYISGVLVQSDDKIIVIGQFSGVGGFNRTNISRLDPNGVVDQSFNAGSNFVAHNVWQQPDGKYIVADGTILKRLNIDGTQDTGFANPTFANQSGTSLFELNAVEFTTSGDIIVGGSFDRMNGLTRYNLVRLKPDGTLVTTAFPDGTDRAVKTINRIAGNDLVIGGSFSRFEPLSRIGLAKVTISPVRESTPFDFNGDGRSDITVFRPANGVWYSFFGSTFSSEAFGSEGDLTVPADYDGDGKTDIGIFRPSAGTWWYKGSSTGAAVAIQWGTAGDIPRPSDFDGDGRADFIVYRPLNGTWYRFGSTGQMSFVSLGEADDIPLVADMDGDGKSDPTIFRPSTGAWWYLASSASNALRSTTWGMAGDIPVPADYDGDSKTDVAVFRPSNGVWYILRSADMSYDFRGFGLAGDRPVAADYDGDGKTDIAVFRPSDQVWYILQSTAGFTGVRWGFGTDMPAQSSYLP